MPKVTERLSTGHDVSHRPCITQMTFVLPLLRAPWGRGLHFSLLVLGRSINICRINKCIPRHGITCPKAHIHQLSPSFCQAALWNGCVVVYTWGPQQSCVPLPYKHILDALKAESGISLLLYFAFIIFCFDFYCINTGSL